METGKKNILTVFFNAENNNFSITDKYKGDFAHCEKKIHFITFHEISDKTGNYFIYVGLFFLAFSFFFFFPENWYF